MINIKELNKEDIKRAVIYTDSVGEKTPGCIKSWNNKWIFVVYNCDDDWDNYQNYTAAATDPYDLEFISE